MDADGGTLRLWRHYPWLLGLLTAPLFAGAVPPEGQAWIGLLLGLSALLLFDRLGTSVRPLVPGWLKCCALVLVLAPLAPLPLRWLQPLSPERVALAHAFPVDPAAPPSWLPLTISPANTLDRLWNLAELLAGFGLARLAAAEKGFPRLLAWGLAVGVLLQSGCDLWYRLDPTHSPLGWWKPSWPDGAGTFVNRNDFAGWLYVAVLGAAGWVIRGLKPMRAARVEAVAPADRCPAEWLPLAAVLAFGLVMAVATGSRGGTLAFLVGGAVFATLLVYRSRSRTRVILIGLVTLGALAVMLPAADRVLRRWSVTRAEALSHHSKLEIWRQSMALALKFPITGTGLGTFATAFNHFKTSGGLSTFTHTENDYLQWLVETGAVGALVLAGLLGFAGLALARCLRHERMSEPESMFAASTALAAFAAHAGVEFVFEIPANALLAAALLGFCVGCRDQGSRPVAPSPIPGWRLALNLIAAIALITVAALQGAAAWNWRQARRAQPSPAQVDALRRSIACWPWATQRRIGLVRAEFNQSRTNPLADRTAQARRVQAQLDHALSWDPFNWELRLERAWLSLRLFPDSPRTRAEVWQAVRLNPLQPQIPLRFAQFLGSRNPDLALSLLGAADFSSGEYLPEALSLAWRLRHQPALLWELTPNSAPALLALGDFALDQKLFPLAVQVYLSLTNRIDPLRLAEGFLRAQRPDLTLATLPRSAPGPHANLLRARAFFATGQFAQAIACAELVWRANPNHGTFESANARPGTPAAQTAAALTEAEQEFARPPETRNLGRLRRWHEQFPTETRLTWMLYRTELALGHEEVAARAALELAAQSEPRE